MNQSSCRIGTVFIITLLLLGCKNKIERQIVGSYHIYKLVGINNSIDIDSPLLILNPDKSFDLNIKSKQIHGKWEADDYRDWITIDLYTGESHAQGTLDGENLEILDMVSPQNIFIEADTCVFKRVEKR